MFGMVLPTIQLVIEAKEEIKIENDENIYKLLITIIILILIIIIGVFYFKKAS
jgi:flagellar biogenesis protein FliO